MFFHDNIAIMVEVRACVYFLVLLVELQVVIGSPILGGLWCNLMCEDDYDDSGPSTTSATPDDYIDDWFCSDCRPNRRRTSTSTSTTAGPTTVSTTPPLRMKFNMSGSVMTVDIANPNSNIDVSIMSGTTAAPAAAPAAAAPAAAAPAAAPAAAAPAAAPAAAAPAAAPAAAAPAAAPAAVAPAAAPAAAAPAAAPAAAAPAAAPAEAAPAAGK